MRHLDLKPQPWMEDAACRDHDPDDWHTDARGPNSTKAIARAKAVCASCPVRQRCLDWQLAYEADDPRRVRIGVYGGLTGAERARLAMGGAA